MLSLLLAAALSQARAAPPESREELRAARAEVRAQREARVRAADAQPREEARAPGDSPGAQATEASANAALRRAVEERIAQGVADGGFTGAPPSVTLTTSTQGSSSRPAPATSSPDGGSNPLHDLTGDGPGAWWGAALLAAIALGATALARRKRGGAQR